jgi:hypothetical protein
MPALVLETQTFQYEKPRKGVHRNLCLTRKAGVKLEEAKATVVALSVPPLACRCDTTSVVLDSWRQPWGVLVWLLVVLAVVTWIRKELIYW